ncbi:DUF6255 family natural product biosynthesis protein [Streptomyces triculaminicus]|uniref:DUF6255 family natural product biosynthesis protein n=1 Tax=Streptomyces triculaminicus TaxID=2816232 RepID=UPI0033C827FD
MMRSMGRLVDNCPHTSGWDATHGEERCRSCGTRRFTQYGALRPPGLPVTLAPSPRDKGQADRSASMVIAHTLGRLSGWRPRRAAYHSAW